LLIKYVMTQFP